MLEIDIEGLSVTGDGVGRLKDGRVVFVAGALPGDRVQITQGEVRKKVQFANLVNIVTPSTDRVESQCRIERCGGCALRAFSMTGQATTKRQRVVDAMRRVGGLDVDAMLGAIKVGGQAWAYRHRARMHAEWGSDRWLIGYRSRRSHSVIPFANCPIVWPELEKHMAGLVPALSLLPKNAGIREIEIAYSRRDERAAVRISCNGSLKSYREMLNINTLSISGIEVRAKSKVWRDGNLELRYDHSRAESFDLVFEPGTFSQANPQVNDLLVTSVMAAVRPREHPHVLELHAGIGNFSIALATAGAHMVAIENNQRSVLLALRNAQRAGVKVDVRSMTDVAGVEQEYTQDVALLNPPRTGARDAVALLSQRGPTRVIYVSCDPATLARDSKCLTQESYVLTQIEAFDMFPQTPHVETMAVFERRPRT